MARGRIAARAFVRGKPVMDVPPMIGRDVARVDARRLDSVDQPEDLRDFGPAMNAEQHIAARIDLWNCGAGLARSNSMNDVERRTHRAIFIRHPADQTEHLACRIAFDALAATDNPGCDRFAEFEPVFALAFAPDQRDVGQLRSIAQPRFGGPRWRRVAIPPQARVR